MRKAHTAFSALLVGAVGILFAGCQSAGTRTSDLQPPPVEMVGSAWILVSLGGQLPEGEKAITLEFARDGKFSGHAGVNSYFGSYQIRRGSGPRGEIAISEIGSTKMAGAPELMQQEQRYLDALRQATLYMAEGGLLEFRAGNQPLLRYRQMERAAGESGTK